MRSVIWEKISYFSIYNINIRSHLWLVQWYSAAIKYTVLRCDGKKSYQCYYTDTRQQTIQNVQKLLKTSEDANFHMYGGRLFQTFQTFHLGYHGGIVNAILTYFGELSKFLFNFLGLDWCSYTDLLLVQCGYRFSYLPWKLQQSQE